MASDEPGELAALGPFFAVGRRPEGAGWLPLRALLDGPSLEDRVHHVQDVLGRLAGAEIEPRVAASTLSLGLFARLISPVLAATVLDLPLPRPGLDDAWWRPVAAGPWPLALTGPLESADPEGLLTEVIAPLIGRLAASYSLSTKILRGNAASALFGATTMLVTARPDLARGARATAAALLAGPLEGTGDLDATRFVRRSCCLYYRIPGGGYCGDCVLTASSSA